MIRAMWFGAPVLVVCIGTGACAQPASAQGQSQPKALVNGPPTAPEDVSTAIDPILRKHNIPGMAVLVMHGQDVVALGAAGVRKTGDPTPITVDDKFHIGSCTKSMTATMIATLVEEGKLRWSTTMGEVFTDLK